MFSLLAAAMTSEYVLISPPKYLEAWKGYVEMRQEDHPDVSFSVTNSFEIYDAYPFPGWMKGGEAVEPVCSNAAESIYHYIRDRWNPDVRQYYVLGGTWLNVEREPVESPWTNRVIRVRTADGEILSVTNAIPGVGVSADLPPYGDFSVPSDVFYACLGEWGREVQRHPWYDAKTDSYFPSSMTNDTVDTVPDVVVSRIPFVVWTNAVGRTVSVEESITNFAKKVRVAESSDFPGRHCYALLASSGVRGQLAGLTGVVDGDNPHRFFDGFDEYCDEDFPWPASDAGIAVRYRLRRWIVPYSPLRRGLLSIRLRAYDPSSDVNVEEFFSGDWEMALAKSHGEPDCLTETGITSDRFLAMTNLCKILMFPMPCDTGWPDWYPESDLWVTPTNILQLSLAATALFNPDGGSVAGIHNSRPGFGGEEPIDVANCVDGQSSEIEEFVLEEVFSNRVNIGEAWMRGLGRYARPERRLSGKAILVALQEMLYGDPLIAITPHEASADESVVRWGVSGDCELPPVWRVTDAASVTNGNLSASGIGGINRLEFSRRRGDLTLAGDGEFFVNAVTNGGTLAIGGCNKHVRLESCDITNLVLFAAERAVLTNELSVSASARLTKLEIAIDGDVLLRATGTNVYSVAQGVHVSGRGRLTIPNVGLFGPNVTADPGGRLEYNSGKRKGLILIFR